MSMVHSFGASFVTSSPRNAGHCGVWHIKQILGDGMIEAMVVVDCSTAMPRSVESTLVEVILIEELLEDLCKMEV